MVLKDTATTETYTLSLHDALPIFSGQTDNTNDAGLLPIDLELTKGVDNATPLVGSNVRSEEHMSELQALRHIVCRTLLKIKDVLPSGLSYDSDDIGGSYNSSTAVS